MSRIRLGAGIAAVTALALTIPVSAMAQGDPAPRGGAGTNLPGGGGGAGGGGGDRAVSRPDSGGGGAASGGSGSSGGSSGGSNWSGGSGGSGFGSSWSNPESRRAAAADAARRRTENRGEDGSRRYGASSDAASGTIPWYSRNREGRPIVGTAAGREEVGRPRPGGGGTGTTGYQDLYITGYRSMECRAFGFGAYGMGYFYVDPSWYSPNGYFPGCKGGYYSADYPGYGYYGYGGYGGYGGGYWGGTTYWSYYGGGGGGGYSGESGPSTNASIKLKVKPSNAQVFIDGYFAGAVDDFDGAFQKLPVRAGEHRLEFRAPGYEALIVDVRVGPYEILNYKAELKRQ